MHLMTSNADILRKIDPVVYFDHFLSEGVYPDGRDTSQFRPCKIESCIVDDILVPGCYNVVQVQQDGSAVSCSAKLSIGPDADGDSAISFVINPNDGFRKEVINEWNVRLKKLFLSRQNLFLDASLLRVSLPPTPMKCLFEQLRWTVHLDITLLNSNGLSAFGAMLTAVQAVLIGLKFPSVEYNLTSDEEMIRESDKNTIDEDFEVSLPFDPSRLKFTWRKTEETNNSGYILREPLVYIPFLFYKSLNDKNDSNSPYELLCDPSGEVCNILGGSDGTYYSFCELILGPNGCIHQLSTSVSSFLPVELIDEAVSLGKRRYIAVKNALKRYVTSLK